VSKIIACKSKRSSSAGGSESGQDAMHDSKVHHKRAYSKGSSKSSRHHLHKKGKDTADDTANVIAAHVFNRGMDRRHKQEQRDEQSTSMNIHNNESESSIASNSKVSLIYISAAILKCTYQIFSLLWVSQESPAGTRSSVTEASHIII
jgi:hypothetical protein